MGNKIIKNNKVFRIDYNFCSWSLPVNNNEHILYTAKNINSIDINMVKSIVQKGKDIIYEYVSCKELSENEVLLEKLNGYEISNLF